MVAARRVHGEATMQLPSGAPLEALLATVAQNHSLASCSSSPFLHHQQHQQHQQQQHGRSQSPRRGTGHGTAVNRPSTTAVTAATTTTVSNGKVEPEVLLDPIFTALRVTELTSMWNLDLTYLRNKWQAEKAHKEYIPWYVRGRLPEDMAKELGAHQEPGKVMPVFLSRPATVAAPTITLPAPTTPAPAGKVVTSLPAPPTTHAEAATTAQVAAGLLPPSGAGLDARQTTSSGGTLRRRKIGTGTHADLMVAVGESLPAGLAATAAATATMRRGRNTSERGYPGGAEYAPIGFQEWMTAHLQHGYDLDRTKHGFRGLMRCKSREKAMQGLHDQLLVVAVTPGDRGCWADGVEALEEASGQLRPATAPLPLTAKEARRRWGQPSTTSHTPRPVTTDHTARPVTTSHTPRPATTDHTARPATTGHTHRPATISYTGRPATVHHATRAAANHHPLRQGISAGNSPLTSPRGPLVPTTRKSASPSAHPSVPATSPSPGSGVNAAWVAAPGIAVQQAIRGGSPAPIASTSAAQQSQSADSACVDNQSPPVVADLHAEPPYTTVSIVAQPSTQQPEAWGTSHPQTAQDATADFNTKQQQQQQQQHREPAEASGGVEEACTQHGMGAARSTQEERAANRPVPRASSSTPSGPSINIGPRSSMRRRVSVGDSVRIRDASMSGHRPSSRLGTLFETSSARRSSLVHMASTQVTPRLSPEPQGSQRPSSTGSLGPDGARPRRVSNVSSLINKSATRAALAMIERLASLPKNKDGMPIVLSPRTSEDGAEQDKDAHACDEQSLQPTAALETSVTHPGSPQPGPQGSTIATTTAGEDQPQTVLDAAQQQQQQQQQLLLPPPPEEQLPTAGEASVPGPDAPAPSHHVAWASSSGSTKDADSVATTAPGTAPASTAVAAAPAAAGSSGAMPALLKLFRGGLKGLGAGHDKETGHQGFGQGASAQTVVATGGIRVSSGRSQARLRPASSRQSKGTHRQSPYELVYERAVDRRHRWQQPAAGAEGPGLLYDWREAALHMLEKLPRNYSMSRAKDAAARARSASSPTPRRSALSSRQSHRQGKNAKFRVSHKGAALWKRLAAIGPRRLLAIMAGAKDGGHAQLSFLQHLQNKQNGLAAMARARLRALERVTPSLRHAPTTITNLGAVPELPTPPATAAGLPRLDINQANDDQPEILQTPRADGALMTPPDTALDVYHQSDGFTRYTGAMGGADKLKARLQAQNEALVHANPVAFNEDTAAQTEAEHRAAMEKAELRLKAVVDGPGVTHQPEQKLVNALQAAVRELHVKRPFFHGPQLTRPRVSRAAVKEAESGPAAEKPPWKLETSIFALRRKECEARDFYDNPKVKTAQFQLDWDRVVGKTRFKKLVAREDKAVAEDSEGLDQELAEVRQELEAQKDNIRAMFNYYSMITGGCGQSDVLNITMNQWLGFCNEAHIIDTSGQRGTTSGDLQTVFVAVNFEEESNTQEGQANDDDAMMRFEFLEGIVRSAFGKYIATKKCDDASDAVHMLLHQTILPSMPPEALVDPNEFRRERLYNEEMDESVRNHLEILQAMYKLYKAKDRTKYFNLEHWASLLEATELIGEHTGIEYREIKMIFVWSQMIVTDELKRRKRATALMFFDFLEALARVAELLSPPTPEEVDAWFLEQAESGLTPRLTTTLLSQPSVAAGAPRQSTPMTPSVSSPGRAGTPGSGLRGSPSLVNRTASGPGAASAPAAGSLGVCRLSDYFKLVGAAGANLKRESAELCVIPTRPLVEKFEQMLEVMVFRLRAIWGGRTRRTVLLG